MLKISEIAIFEPQQKKYSRDPLLRKNGSRVLCKNQNKYDKKTTLAKGLHGRIQAFVESFSSCFKLINSRSQEVCSDYLFGLYVSDKRNCDKISKKVERHSQSL
ncbi:MAG: hypothetical protein ACK576_05810, partial [Cyclobacteriaceae bacterium]